MTAISTRPIRTAAVGIFDGPHATPAESDSGPIFLGIKNITANGRLDFSEIRHVSEHEFSKWTRRVQPQEGDVVFTYEATLHRYAIIPPGFVGCLGRRVALVRPDTEQLDSRFLLYYFLSHDWRSVVEASVITGATVDRIPLERFPDFPVRLPPLETQRAIAEVLANYDDLIENSRRRIALLEDAARLLYEEWFVRLRFPGYENVRLVKGVPEGWERKALADVADSSLGKMLDEKKNKGDLLPYLANVNVRWGEFDLENLRMMRFEQHEIERFSVRPGDIVMCEGGEPGRCAVWRGDRPMMFQKALHRIRARGNVDQRFLYYELSRQGHEGRFAPLFTGTTIKHFPGEKLAQAEVALPPLALQQRFSEVVSAFDDGIENNRRQNEKLCTARDLLLPRLMSGEVAA